MYSNVLLRSFYIYKYILVLIVIEINNLCIIIIDYQDPVKYVVEDIKADKKITDLASVILKIEQSIEPKFLRRPLGNITIFIFNFQKINNILAVVGL